MSTFLRGISPIIRLPSRGYRFTRRIIITGLNRLYAWPVIQYVRRQEGFSKSALVKPAFNSVIIADHNKLCKIALHKKNTVNLEYSNFEKIRKNYPTLLTVLPDYKIQKSAFFSYLLMPRYRPVGIEASLAHACTIYKLMRECGSPEKQFEISKSGELLTGLKVISNVYGDSVSQRIYQFIDSYLESGKYRVGFAHGDFHFRNILSDDNGAPRLIDLDCVRLHGIQELDALYFVLEMEWSKSGKPWYETIASYLKGGIPTEAGVVLDRFCVEYSHGLAVTCLIDRLGQE